MKTNEEKTLTGPPEKGWKPYGQIPYVKKGDEHIFLWRKTTKCRWLTALGEQIGPEQLNVGPALVWAIRNGYRDQTLENAGIGVRSDDPIFK